MCVDLLHPVHKYIYQHIHIYSSRVGQITNNMKQKGKHFQEGLVKEEGIIFGSANIREAFEISEYKIV